MVTSDTYQIIDAAGWRLAEVTFNRAIDEGLRPIYLQDICESMGAYGYHHTVAIKKSGLSEFGQLIAD